MIKILQPDFVHEDHRGRLVQLVHKGYSQVNVITSKAGVVRGGHFHKQNRELFFVINGSFRVRVRKDGKEKEYSFTCGDMFMIPEQVSHDFIYDENTVLVSMYTKGVQMNDGSMDIYEG